MNSNIFSIEIFIDRIRLLEGEKCYFPSTVLKLLSYEPTLISTVEYDIQLKLREYLDLIENSTEPKKIDQISELKDIDGNYVIRKGKSILFEAKTISLIAEFNALPLYILVCDDYFQPSHLVGVIAIKLSDAMVRLSKKITQCCHTVSEDIMGKFPIVNLMGDGVGIATLKLRLLYIGPNLAPHLIREHEIEIKRKSKMKDPVGKSVGNDWSGHEEESAEKITVRTIGCQVNKKRNVRIQMVPEPIDEVILQKNDNLSQVGLTIDPNDPILKDLPPMIYNSDYGTFSSDSSDNEPISPRDSRKPFKSFDRMPSKPSKTDLNDGGNMPILTALMNELKSWKSQENLTTNRMNGDEMSSKSSKIAMKKQITKKKPITRSKSEDNQSRYRLPDNIPSHRNRQEFLNRLSQPKYRPPPPTGIVPKHIGWIRKEPEYCGPMRSGLNYKLTRTQAKRIEINHLNKQQREDEQQYSTCRRQYHPDDSHQRRRPQHQPQHQQQQQQTDDDQNDNTEFTSPTHTPVPRVKRNPLVPPLFGTGTSFSGPSFTMTGSTTSHDESQIYHNNKSNKRIHKRPPQSPGKENRQWNINNNHNNNNNNINVNNQFKSFSYDTNETANEADHYLNLNPVQSNRSPHMSVRSHIAPLNGVTDGSSNDYDDNCHGDCNNNNNNNNDVDDDDDNYDREDSEYHSDNDDERENRAYEYSDEFNQSYSSGNIVMRSNSRRHSNGSQISQTSEWRTDYSFGSSTSQRNQPNIESPSQSPDLRTHRSPPRSPTKPRRSLLSTGVIPGGRFLDGTGNSSLRTFDSFKPSFNESLEISNFDSSSVMNDDDQINSRQSINGHASIMRPGSAGADVTSFTKVTKYEKSFAPGHLNSNNYLATQYITSTMGSLQTDDSQILTSESYY